MREKITFEPGQAVRVTLDNDTGKPVDGRTGTQYMRVVDDDQRIIFADPALEQAIVEAGAAAGDVVQIVKIGTGKKARWDVAIMGEAAAPQQVPPARQLPAGAARGSGPAADKATRGDHIRPGRPGRRPQSGN